ncbi:MAG: hypothetical protein ACYDC2_10440 [Solirubrobacteraceae bacterium]
MRSSQGEGPIGRSQTRFQLLETSAAGLAVAVALGSLIVAAVALAGSPKRGATYAGATGHGRVPVTLKVSSSGSAVTAAARYPPLYCRGSAGAVRASAKPAPIDGGGYFRATISYEYVPSHTVTAELMLTGRFTGRNARGVARSVFPRSASCSGATTFIAWTS